MIGIAEILFGLAWLFYARKRRLFVIQMMAFPFLATSAIMANLDYLLHPFNPLTFNITLFILSIIGFLLAKTCPQQKVVSKRDKGIFMSIYKQVMGDDFFRLQPMLQKRYEFFDEVPFQATGIMKKIQGGPKYLFPFFWLGVKWKLLFPERGNDIPFTIRNTPLIGGNGDS